MLVTILGPYTGPDVLTVAGNCRRAHELAIELMRRGFTVYDPMLDLQWALMAEIPLGVFKANSLEITLRSDAVILTQGWENSEGVREELPQVRRQGIPVFKQ